MKKRISDIPKSDRPREKLQQKGAESLSDLELLAVLVGSGTKKHDVMTLANNILKVIDQSGGTADVQEHRPFHSLFISKSFVLPFSYSIKASCANCSNTSSDSANSFSHFLSALISSRGNTSVAS